MNEVNISVLFSPKQLETYYDIFERFVKDNYRNQDISYLDRLISKCFQKEYEEKCATIYIKKIGEYKTAGIFSTVHSISSTKTIEDKYLDKFLKLSFALNISLEEYLLQLYRENKLGNQL